MHAYMKGGSMYTPFQMKGLKTIVDSVLSTFALHTTLSPKELVTTNCKFLSS